MTIAWVALTFMVFAYGTANFLQAIAATRGQADEQLSPGLLFKLVRHKTYLAGVACQGIGTITSFLARRDLPLFLVQAAVCAGIIVTALLGVLVLHWKLPRAEVALIAIVLVGVSMLIMSAKPSKANNPSTLIVVGIAAMVLVIAVAAHFGARLHGAPGSVVLGGLAGAAFGLAAIASRPLVNASSISDFVTDPLLYIFLVHMIAGQLCLGMALQRGATTAASASMNAMSAIPPAIIGLLLLGDHIKDGMHLMAAGGFALTIAGTAALAWYAQPQSHTRAKTAPTEIVPEQTPPMTQASLSHD